MADKSLALAIPTYNRADILEENLLAMRASLEALGIAVHVLDDSNNGDTARMAARLASTTGIELHYRRNQPPLRHDANLISALNAPQTDWVWLLGDACLIDDVGLQAVHAALKDQDFVFVNSRGNAVPDSALSLHGAQARDFIAQRAWDFSLTGATVYARRVIDWWRADPGHVPYANFPQLSVILAYVAAHPQLNLRWLGERVVRINPRKSQSYWLVDAIPVWAADWYRVVTAHTNAFDAEALPAVLRSHSKHTQILGFKHLLVLRAAGLFDAQVLARHREALMAASSAGGWAVAAIAALPRAAAERVVAARPSWRRRFPLPDRIKPK